VKQPLAQFHLVPRFEMRGATPPFLHVSSHRVVEARGRHILYFHPPLHSGLDQLSQVVYIYMYIYIYIYIYICGQTKRVSCSLQGLC
jgi:hypothetical protein